MDKMRIIARLFTMISSGVLLVAAAYITFFWGAETDISIMVLWQILGASALCSLIGFFFPDGKKEPSKKKMLLQTILCFLYENAVVLTCAFAFDWIVDSDPRMIAAMEISIIAVFGGVYLAGYLSDCREAEKMNQKLNMKKMNK
ncbi:MAG: DUF3021 domain-containing protein [Oscillospiraceae bacterium]|nr:DUF3021 domain-containing protein [Oscillospiraceae bacterium]